MGFEPTTLRDLDGCSKTHISPLLTMESPVAQWLEHPVWVQIPSGAWIFFSSFHLMHKLNCCCKANKTVEVTGSKCNHLIN